MTSPMPWDEKYRKLQNQKKRLWAALLCFIVADILLGVEKVGHVHSALLVYALVNAIIICVVLLFISAMTWAAVTYD